MPFEDGYTLIRKIRELEAESNQREPVPAVALTAYAREEDCKNAIASGFQIHMSKPVNTAQFVMEVANLTGRTLTENQSAASF
jgi:CheY-like chemotaxis protein